MDVTHSRDDLTPVHLGELDQVHRLLAVIAPVEVGRYPGVQLSRTRTGRVWTLIGDGCSVDVRVAGSIDGLCGPVWMNARSIRFARDSARDDGWCGLGIDDRRPDGHRSADSGVLSALVSGPCTDARIELVDRRPVLPMRPPATTDVIATAVSNLADLHRAIVGAARVPQGVTPRERITATFTVLGRSLVVDCRDPYGAELSAQFRLHAATDGDTNGEVGVTVDADRLQHLTAQLPPGEVIVTLTRNGTVWLVAGTCRVAFRGDARVADPSEASGIVFLVGFVEDTEEPVLSFDGDCPTDGVTVWLESEPHEPDLLERIEELHEIVWYAEPEPYGVSAGDD